MSVAIDLAHIWGNDLTIAPNGDIALSIDVPGTPQATFERVMRAILTNALVLDDQGNPIVPPDYIFHTGFGAGARAAIGEAFTPTLQKSVNARILNALNADPYIQPNSISISWQQGPIIGEYLLTVSCNSILGQPFVVPVPLTFAGS